MDNANILIKPEELQSEIDGFRKANATITALKYDVQAEQTVLTSIDKMRECVDKMNAIIAAFGTLCETDIHNLEIIRASWQNMDQSLAGQSFVPKSFTDPLFEDNSNVDVSVSASKDHDSDTIKTTATATTKKTSGKTSGGH